MTWGDIPLEGPPLRHYRETTFECADVELDGRRFTGCTFRDVGLIFGDGPAPEFEQCRFEGDVRWFLNGTARAFAELLATLYHSGGQGGRQLVEGFFDDVRHGGPWLKPPPAQDE